MNDLALEAQKEKEALAAAKAAREAVDGQNEAQAVEKIMDTIEGANDREQLSEDLTDLPERQSRNRIRNCPQIDAD